MRSKASERRGRHKGNRPSPYRIENDFNPDDMPQYFEITVNVIEARKLVWSNQQSPNSYVIVVLGTKKHRTTIRRNTEEPFYREFFIFEMYVSIRDVQLSSLWLAVMEPKCCAPPRLLGETTIDLRTVWAQPYHHLYHKWAQLSLPRDSTTGPVGFLKVDISMTFRGEVQIMPVIANNDNVEDNLLLSTGSEQQRANYVVTVYDASGLPNTSPGYGHGDKRIMKSPSTFVRVSFCGLVAKTAVQHRTNHPKYCEQVSIVEMFPNMDQILRLEVCSAEGSFNRVLASTDLRLGQISHDGENGFLPTFGPSLLHMYGISSTGLLGTTGEDGPYYRGALLVSLKTVVPYYQQGVRSISVQPVSSIQADNLWIHEDFCIFCPIMEVSMLDRRIAGQNCGVAITIGEIPCENKADEEFSAMMNELRTKKYHYTGSLDVIKSSPLYGFIEFPNAFPILQLATRLPDFRFRMYRNNMVHGIVANLELALADVEGRLETYEYNTPSDLVDELNKAVDDAAGNILKFLDLIQYSSHASSEHQYSTDLDQKQMEFQKGEIEQIYKQMTRKTTENSSLCLLADRSYGGDNLVVTKKSVKLMLAENKALVQSLRNIIFKTSEGWPEIVMWLLNEGTRVAFYKLSTADFIYSVIPEQCGRDCGRIQTVYMKPMKCPKHMNTLASGCFCIASKIELMCWIGSFRQKAAFNGFLPYGYTLKSKGHDKCIKANTMMVEIRAFMYKAKLNNSLDGSKLTNPYARINALSSVKETKVKQKTWTPVWNQVLKIQRVMITTPDRLATSPPIVLVEIYDKDLSGKSDLIGRFQIQPVADDRPGYDYAPKLQWYDIYKGVEHTGKVLMSAQILQIPEKILKSTGYSPIEETIYYANVQEANKVSDAVESLPTSLIPKSSSYKIDVYWWGLREVNITRRPCVMLEIDELIIKSDIIVDKKSNSNFPNGKSSHMFVSPLNEVYCPPLNVRLYYSSTFGRTVFLGTNVVKNPYKFVVSWMPKTEREASVKSSSIIYSNVQQVMQTSYVKKMKTEENDILAISSMKSCLSQQPSPRTAKRSKWRRLFSRKEPDEEEYTLLPVNCKEKGQLKGIRKLPKYYDYKDWWLRYFCSQKEYMSEYDSTEIKTNITIYHSELELQPEFSKFKDWCSTIKLYNGNKTGIPEKDDQLHCGFLKAGIAIYKWPPPEDTVAVGVNGIELDRGYFDDHPSNENSQYLVRVYVVKAINLMTKNSTRKLFPYVVVSCGKKHLGDRKSYIRNGVEPIFGQLFELRCTFPEDYLLTISLYDYDAMSTDELIGSTEIDLEDRVYTKHRAQVGLPKEYSLSGPCKWRDHFKPSDILIELCTRNHISEPIFYNNSSVFFNGIEYKESKNGKVKIPASERKENICLNLLHNWHALPIVGYQLVPEHIETRHLINPDKPDCNQGKIQLWLDIFPLQVGSTECIPDPIDITPREAEEYELRIIVWNVESVIFDNFDVTEKTWKAADIYVKAWIGSTNNAQCTDVHLNSISGEGSFNWRMIFHFSYQHASRKMIHKEQGPFTEYEQYVLPILVVHVLESDADEFLGSLSLNLNKLPRGMSKPQRCSLGCTDRAQILNLFSSSSIRGWWPLTTVNMNTGQEMFAGAIELDLRLLPKEHAVVFPVGLGRNPPSPLPPPRRARTEDCCILDKFMQTLETYKTAILTIILIVIIIAFALVLYLKAGEIKIFLFGTRFSHLHKPKHVEGIIRTLYPAKAKQGLIKFNIL